MVTGPQSRVWTLKWPITHQHVHVVRNSVLVQSIQTSRAKAVKFKSHQFRLKYKHQIKFMDKMKGSGRLGGACVLQIRMPIKYNLTSLVRHSFIRHPRYCNLHIFVRPNFFVENSLFYMTMALDKTTFRVYVLSYWRGNELKFFSSMLCLSKIHPFSLGNYLRISIIIGSLMKIRVTNVELTWLGLEWPPSYSFVKLWAWRCLQHGWD